MYHYALIIEFSDQKLPATIHEAREHNAWKFIHEKK